MDLNDKKKREVDEAYVTMDTALSLGMLAWPVEKGERYLFTTARYDCSGTVVNFGPFGVQLENVTRIFESGALQEYLIENQAPRREEKLPDGHIIMWGGVTEISPQSSAPAQA